MSSAARVARRCSFVCSATSLRASIRAHGVCAVSSTLVMWLPVRSPRRSFWLGRNQFTMRCSARYSRFRRSPPLLFHMRVVVPLVRTGTGEGDVPGTTEAGEMSGRGPRSRYPHAGRGPSRVPVETGRQCSDHNHLCVHAYGPRLGASGVTVRDGQCPAEVSRHLSSASTHQVHGGTPGIRRGGSIHV